MGREGRRLCGREVGAFGVWTVWDIFAWGLALIWEGWGNALFWGIDVYEELCMMDRVAFNSLYTLDDEPR